MARPADGSIGEIVQDGTLWAEEEGGWAGFQHQGSDEHVELVAPGAQGAQRRLGPVDVADAVDMLAQLGRLDLDGEDGVWRGGRQRRGHAGEARGLGARLGALDQQRRRVVGNGDDEPAGAGGKLGPAVPAMAKLVLEASLGAAGGIPPVPQGIVVVEGEGQVGDGQQGGVDMVDGRRGRLAVDDEGRAWVAIVQQAEVDTPHGGSAWVWPWLHRRRHARGHDGRRRRRECAGKLGGRGRGACMRWPRRECI